MKSQHADKLLSNTVPQHRLGLLLRSLDRADIWILSERALSDAYIGANRDIITSVKRFIIVVLFQVTFGQKVPNIP